MCQPVGDDGVLCNGVDCERQAKCWELVAWLWVVTASCSVAGCMLPRAGCMESDSVFRIFCSQA